MAKTKVNFQDIRFEYNKKKKILRLSEHINLVDPIDITPLLSKYLFYEDFFSFNYVGQKFDLERIYVGLDVQKRQMLRDMERKSVDDRGKITFKVTEQMIKGEIVTSPQYIQAKKCLNDTLFILNRIRSGIRMLEWKLEITTNGRRPRGTIKEPATPKQQENRRAAE